MGTKRRRRTASNPVTPLPDGFDPRSQTDEIPSEISETDPEVETLLLTPPPGANELEPFSLPALDGTDPIRELTAALIKRREALGMSIADVARASHMSPRTVTRLEHEALEELDAPFYVKNRLRLYAGALRLDADEVVLFFEAALEVRSSTANLRQGSMHLSQYLPWLIGGAAALTTVIVLMLKLW